MNENQGNESFKLKENKIRNKFFGIMDVYHNQDAKLGMELAIKEMTPFIHYIIKKRFSSYSKHYEDLLSQGTIGVMVGLPKYDPNISAPSTFFNFYIMHEISRYVDTFAKKTSSYYSSTIGMITKAKEKLEKSGQEYNEIDIARETGLNMDTISHCMKLLTMTNEMYIESEDFVEAQITEKSLSPEEEYIRKEESEAIHKAVMSLGEETPFIRMKFGLDGAFPLGIKVSDKDVAKRIGTSIEKVKRARHNAIRKLRNMPELRALFYDHFSDSEEDLLEEKQIAFVPVEIAKKMMDQCDEIEINF